MLKTRWALGILVLILLGIIGVYRYTPSSLRVSLAQNAVVRFLQPTYRSFRKIADLPYVFYAMRNTKLPVYEIAVATEDLQKMNAALPVDTVKGRLLDENKVTVKADFTSADYTDRVEIRYRGRGPNHWNAYKKSLHIEFPDDHPLHGITELKLFIPEDRNYLIEPLNMERARRLGLFTPEPFFVRVKLNGEDMGVYTAMSHWSSGFADRAGYGETANFFGIQDFSLDELQNRNFFDPKELSAWEDYTKTTELNPEGLIALRDMLTVLHTASDEEFKRALPAMVNMDALYTWLILNTLASSAHQNSTVNIVLLRDPSTGLMQPLPWNIDIFPMGTMSLDAHPLIGRTLEVPEFRAEYLRRLASYVHDDAMLDADLAFYDAAQKKILPELFSDTVKLPLNVQVSRDFKNLREHIITNYKALQKLENEGNLATLLQGEYTTYGPLTTSTLSPFMKSAMARSDSFLASHPEFIKISSQEFSLGPGIVTLSGTTILPTGFSLRVLPGTTILMSPNSSLVVYGSLVANGTTVPITFSGASWKSIIVIGGTHDNVTMKNVTMRGGSGFSQDGRNATGMLAIYGVGQTDIQQSTFTDTFDDDAVNVKRGIVSLAYNTFARTFGDAIDIDSGSGTIHNNRFGSFGFLASKGHGPNGDGIDMSLSSLTIEKNVVIGCGDKGISVGEASDPTIRDNVITDCAIGIGIKDQSRAVLENNVLIGNTTGISLYQKKPLFGGSSATMKNTVLWKNGTSLSIDPLSRVSENIGTLDSSLGAAKESVLNALSAFTRDHALSLIQ